MTPLFWGLVIGYITGVVMGALGKGFFGAMIEDFRKPETSRYHNCHVPNKNPPPPHISCKPSPPPGPPSVVSPPPPPTPYREKGYQPTTHVVQPPPGGRT